MHCAYYTVSLTCTIALGKLVTKIDKKRQKVTKTAPTFCHVLRYSSAFVNFDKKRQKLEFVASILSKSTKSDKTIIVVKPPYSTKSDKTIIVVKPP